MRLNKSTLINNKQNENKQNTLNRKLNLERNTNILVKKYACGKQKRIL